MASRMAKVSGPPRCDLCGGTRNVRMRFNPTYRQCADCRIKSEQEEDWKRELSSAERTGMGMN